MSLVGSLKNAQAELQANPRLRYLLYAVAAIVLFYGLDTLLDSLEASRRQTEDAVERIEQLQALSARKGLLEEQKVLTERFQEFWSRLYEADSDSLMKIHVQEWLGEFTKKFAIKSPKLTFFASAIEKTPNGEVRILPVLIESEHNPDDILAILHYIETNRFFLEIDEIKALLKPIDFMSPKRFMLYLNFYYVLKQS